MPTLYPPELDHERFDWLNQPTRFLEALSADQINILTNLGFYREGGGDRERLEVLDRLSGILSEAAAVRLEGGMKPTNRVIATIRAVEKNPSAIFDRSVEPEALGEIAQNYQRADEAPGTFWFDIYPSDALGYQAPSMEQVRKAASMAIVKLKDEASPGNSEDLAAKLLAEKLGPEYSHFNDSCTRQSVVTAKDGKIVQEEGGPLLAFVRAVLRPLNGFLTGRGLKQVSATTVVRLAVDELRARQRGESQASEPDQNALPNCLHNFGLEDLTV